MFEGEDIAFNGLEVCSYRHLQGMAKNMGLPSNVKKVHLIEMIRAKKYCTETDLMAIVDRVKMERKVNAQAKKKKAKRKTFRLQGAEVSSTSNSQSPPISLTPKRPSDFVIQYSPDITQTIMKYQPRPNILRTGTSILQPLKRHIESDRVLRSFGSVKRPNYRIMEQNDCMLGVVNVQKSVQEIRQGTVQEFRQGRAYKSVNVTVQKHRPIVSSSLVMNTDRQLVPISRSSNISKPAKRQRKLSGIYPLQSLEKPYYEYVPTVGFRRTDGRVTKINAVIQKPLSSTLLPKNHSQKAKNRIAFAKNAVLPRTLTVQDMINYKVDHQTLDINKNAVEARSYEIDHQTSENDRHNFGNYQSNEERAIEARNYQVNYETKDSTQMLSSSGSRSIDVDNSRKVYKNLNNTRNKGWSYNIEYQEHESAERQKGWSIYDINDQLLDKANPEQNTTNQEKDQPISTNYRVTQGRITEPISRDYQVEYQRFNQENCKKNSRSNQMRPLKDEKYNEMTASNRYDKEQKEEETIEYRNVTHTIDRDKLDMTHRTTAHATFDKQWINHETDRVNARNDNNNASQYPNMASVSDVFPNEEYFQEPMENSNFAVYYHKKIRAEHVKKAGEDKLPKINDAFSQFNDVQYKSLTQPLYVQVREEAERVPSILRPGNGANSTCMLESIYNFKHQFVTNPPILLIATTQTHCTFSTKTISTAVAQTAAADYCNNINPYERASVVQMDSIPRFYDYLKPEFRPRADFSCNEVLSSSTISIETANSQELGANVTIPEMVEDALELISQDGDYMERIGMDVRVQCILCDWAGSKIILEYHIKKEHTTEIQHEISNEWSMVFSLGQLVQLHTWCSQLVQRADCVYVLSAKYVHADVVLLSLSVIPNETDGMKRGRITVYNKVTGQPYTYEEDIKHIPDSMPYEYGLECLNLDIGKLDLLSRNLRVRDIDQCELNAVEIIVYVKLID